MAVVEVHAGQTNMAATYLAQALQLNPEYAPALYNYAAMQRDMYRNRDKARAAFERFLAVARTAPPPADATPAEKEAASRHVQAAENWMKTAAGGPPGPREPAPGHRTGPATGTAAADLFTSGLAAYNAGKWDNAIEDYKRALDRDPRMAAAAYNLGLAYKSKRDLKRAKDAFAATLRISPNMPDASYMLGIVCHELKDDRTAIDSFEQVLKSKPDYARAHYVLGLIYRDTRKSALAKKHLESFVKLAPNDPHADTARQWLTQMR